MRSFYPERGRKSESPMLRIILAALLSAMAAALVVALTAALSDSGANEPWAVVLHFLIFGLIVAVPIALVVGVPLYCVVQRFGRALPTIVLFGGMALAVAYPGAIWLVNKPGTVSAWMFATCAGAGAVASLVFLRIVKAW